MRQRLKQLVLLGLPLVLAAACDNSPSVDTKKEQMEPRTAIPQDVRGGPLLETREEAAPSAAPQSSQPNIVVIMGDDVGWFNIGAYHRGIMVGKTPNIDKIAAEGMTLTNYYAEASCTAGRSNFITGELPIRTGLATVGQAGSSIGIPKTAPTIATALKSMGYATGQFGKNHLGDLNEFLPCVHGFDEYFGYLYHLDAMEDPIWESYPTGDFLAEHGPRNVVRCQATQTDDPTVMPRWGKIGMQTVADEGTLYPERMETFDDEILEHSKKFIDKAKADGKPFFLWMNPTRMHIFTHLSKKYKDLMNPETGYGLQEAGMAQLDDAVGEIQKKLKDEGLSENTIFVFTTDNGAEVFTWPDGGMTPFRGAKGTIWEGGFRVPALVSWPGKIAPGSVESGIFSGLDWFPTFLAAAGNPTVVQELREGKNFLEQPYKVHLDGYDQSSLLTGQGPSARHEIYYFSESTLGAVRIDDFKYVFIDQPGGWFGPKVKLEMPQLYNLRQDPFERTNFDQAPSQFMDFYAHEFWRFTLVQDAVKKSAESFIEFPPMQKSASFNLDGVKEQIEKAMKGPGN